MFVGVFDSISSAQMISAEAPVLFAKAAQIFITELTLRAWIHTEDNKRRTLQVRHTRYVWTAFLSFFFLYFASFVLIRSRFFLLSFITISHICPW